MQQRHYSSRADGSPRYPENRRTSAPASRAASARPRPAGSDPRPRSPQARPAASGTRNPQRPRSTGPQRPQDRRQPQRRPNQPYGSPPRRPAPRRKARRRISMPMVIIVVCIAAALIYAIHFMSVVGIGTPKFIDNVYINGASLAGLTHEEGIAYTQQLESDWLNENYTLNYLGETWNFSRSMVNADVNYESQVELAWNLGHIGSIFERKRMIDATAASPIYLSCNVSYDESMLDDFIASIAADIDVAPVDAVIALGVDKPEVFVESSTGLAVNREQLKGQLDTLIRTGEFDGTIPVETQFPAVQSDSAQSQVIAAFSTDVSFRGSASKSNVRLALNAFNGICVMPGETVSFNEVVGPRTEANGFKEATEYAGDTTTKGWGGGVCQASTTLYNALIMADMDVIERHRHSMTVSYVDPSQDAAVFEDTKDLRFENNTESPIYIYTSVSDELATVTIYGTRPEYRYELESIIIEENVESTRKTYIEDTAGKYVYYKDDEPVLQSQGKAGCVSEGWLVAYDWETGEEISRVCVNRDTYKPGASVYWRGVHDRTQVGLIQEY